MTVLFSFCTLKLTQDDPMATRWSQICPKWAQDGPRWPPDGPRWSQDGICSMISTFRSLLLRSSRLAVRPLAGSNTLCRGPADYFIILFYYYTKYKLSSTRTASAALSKAMIMTGSYSVGKVIHQHNMLLYF